MARTTSYSMTDESLAYIAAEVKSGRYVSASEVVRDAMRLHQYRQERQNAALAALKNAPTSPTPITVEESERLDEGRASGQTGAVVGVEHAFEGRGSA